MGERTTLHYRRVLINKDRRNVNTTNSPLGKYHNIKTAAGKIHPQMLKPKKLGDALSKESELISVVKWDMSTSCAPEMMYCEGHITSVVFLTKRHNLNLLMKKHLTKVNLEILLKKKTPHQSI